MFFVNITALTIDKLGFRLINSADINLMGLKQNIQFGNRRILNKVHNKICINSNEAIIDIHH